MDTWQFSDIRVTCVAWFTMPIWISNSEICLIIFVLYICTKHLNVELKTKLDTGLFSPLPLPPLPPLLGDLGKEFSINSLSLWPV